MYFPSTVISWGLLEANFCQKLQLWEKHTPTRRNSSSHWRTGFKSQSGSFQDPTRFSWLRVFAVMEVMMSGNRVIIIVLLAGYCLIISWILFDYWLGIVWLLEEYCRIIGGILSDYCLLDIMQPSVLHHWTGLLARFRIILAFWAAKHGVYWVIKWMISLDKCYKPTSWRCLETSYRTRDITEIHFATRKGKCLATMDISHRNEFSGATWSRVEKLAHEDGA